ncbi:MAG: hypothetical protein N2Z81_00255 [Hydrogenothermaceae bacterium]|nr:hypothetical protein [Hydrogenothermaceae bacterium]
MSSLKRYFYLLSISLFMFLYSCAPTVFQPGYCENKFKEQKNIDNSIPETFSFSGSALVSGLPVLLKGKFSNDTEVIQLSNPFGKTMLTIERKDGNLCLNGYGIKSCDADQILSLVSLYMPQAKPLTDINLLKSLVSKKFYLNEGDKYECDIKQLKVIRKDYTLVYEDKDLSKIIYKDYTVEYGLNNQIEIKNGGQSIAKINLSTLNFERN